MPGSIQLFKIYIEKTKSSLVVFVYSRNKQFEQNHVNYMQPVISRWRLFCTSYLSCTMSYIETRLLKLD
jgi:hypothetical protein